MALYTAKYSPSGETRRVTGFELPIKLPIRPARAEMVNYGLPEKEQKFKVTKMPVGIESWDYEKKKKYIAEEWHKRLNGVWMLIKGQEVYIPGTAYFFFNYWHCEFGGLPKFRMEAVDYFAVWEQCLRDPKCLGMCIIKCRRVGDTEKTLCAGYELCTRFRDSWFGMQNVTDTYAEANFARVVKAHQKMAFFFKASTRGNTAPKEAIEFTTPAEAITAKSVKNDTIYSSEFGIGSRIDFRPTVTSQYDGNRMRVYHLDEFGKVDPKKMDIEMQWNIIRPTLTMYNETEVVGKAIFTSTVEDLKSGATIKKASTIWKGSNPLSRDDNGITTTGLYRYFRSFHYGAVTDEYGFHKVEEAANYRANRIKKLEAEKNFKALADFKRKQPSSVEDSLAQPSNECVLLPELIDYQISIISEIEANENHPLRKYLPVQGDLVWANGVFGGDVKWIPHQNGKFFISQHPTIPNNRLFINGTRTPGNIGQYSMGGDPIDHKKPTAGGSDGSFAVRRLHNPLYESALIYDSEGNVTNPEVRETGKFVCTYKQRPLNPKTFYEDALMCAIYYGVSLFPETDKPGILGYFEEKGFYSYLMHKVKTIELPGNNNNGPGAASRGPLIQGYVSRLVSDVAEGYRSYYHKDQLWDYRNFNGENRTECDLMVASGYALLAADFMSVVAVNQEKSKGWKDVKIQEYEIYN